MTNIFGNQEIHRKGDRCGCTETSCEGCTEPSECRNCVDCCCTISHRNWRRAEISRGLLIQYFNNGWMVIEVAAVLIAGVTAANFALIAFGGDSIIELMSGMAVLLHLRRDDSGLKDAGVTASRFSRSLLFVLLPVIGGGTIYSYLAGVKPETSIPGLVVAAIAVGIMPFFWLEKRRIGRSTNCLPLRIDALESATCFFMAAALFIGLALQYLLNAYWIVYVATAVMLAFILREALEAGSGKRQRLR